MMTREEILSIEDYCAEHKISHKKRLEELGIPFWHFCFTPKSRMGKALVYTYTLLPRLSRYVLDGRYNIDNNRVENAIRPLAIGRKNYLFCGNHDAAVRAAIVYSLFSSCKAHEIDVRSCLEDTLKRIPREKNIDQLLPATSRHYRVLPQ